MTRIQGWELALAEEFERAREKPFEWGRHDCGTFALRVYARLRGEEPVIWANYTTPIGLQRAIRKLGFSTHAEVATHLIGPPMDNVLMAKRGDVVLTSAIEITLGGERVLLDEAFGICLGACAAVPGDNGLEFIPMDACQMAWVT